MSLLLNAVFHHSLMMIPQREIPGTVPKAYVMRHPVSGGVEVTIMTEWIVFPPHFVLVNQVTFKDNL